MCKKAFQDKNKNNSYLFPYSAIATTPLKIPFHPPFEEKKYTSKNVCGRASDYSLFTLRYSTIVLYKTYGQTQFRERLNKSETRIVPFELVYPLSFVKYNSSTSQGEYLYNEYPLCPIHSILTLSNAQVLLYIQ